MNNIHGCLLYVYDDIGRYSTYVCIIQIARAESFTSLKVKCSFWHVNSEETISHLGCLLNLINEETKTMYMMLQSNICCTCTVVITYFI